MTIIMFFVGINIIVFKDILVLFLGEKYRACVGLIPFLIFNPIMNILIVTVISGIEVSKKSYLRTIIITISLISEFIISRILMPILGLYGVAISVALSLIIQYFLTLYFSNKFYYVDYGTTKTIVLILMTLALAFVSVYFSNKKLEIAIYLLSMVVLYFLYRDDIKNMLKNLKESLLSKK